MQGDGARMTHSENLVIISAAVLNNGWPGLTGYENRILAAYKGGEVSEHTEKKKQQLAVNTMVC
jgi:hypothetical protein